MAPRTTSPGTLSMMRAWERLTEAGQIRRLRPLALEALEQLPIGPTGLRLVGGFTNVIFQVETAEGPCALRVDLHQEHSDQDVDIELAWLEALDADIDLDVCQPIGAADGRRYVEAGAPGVPGERRCVLFHWIPGRPLADKPTERGYRQLGRLSAGLHAHGRAFVPPSQPMAWDRVFYWPVNVDPVVICEPSMQHHFTGGRMRTLDQAIEVVGDAFERLDPQEAQVVHGDLHPWNVHVSGSSLIGLDFEDVMWGHPVQDIAITFFYQRDHPRYGSFRAAFEEGYREMGVWPAAYEGELETFMAARTLMFINYVANIKEDPAEYYEAAFPRLERFLGEWGSGQ